MTGQQALDICKGCPLFTHNPPKTFDFGLFKVDRPEFHSCGEFLKKIPGVQCGCNLELKTIFHELFSCPQKKW